MPEIARFYGMVIKMFFRDGERDTPHIHVIYGDCAGLIDLETGEMLEGDLPLCLTRGLFEQAEVAGGGYGVCWNDEIDLSCNELYANGKAADEAEGAT